MVHIEAANDELHQCLLSPETESTADCVLTTEDQHGRCELLGAAGTWTARVLSTFCGVAQRTFWRDVFKLALASKRDLKERAMQDELKRKARLKDDMGTPQNDWEAEGDPAPTRGWWHPKPRRFPEMASMTGKGSNEQVGATQRGVGPASPATFWSAPWRSAVALHGGGTKASREEPSLSLAPASTSCCAVGGAQKNKPDPVSTLTSCHLEGGLVGLAVVLLLVRRRVQWKRRNEHERYADSGLPSPDENSSESSPFPCVNVSQ